MKYCREVVLVTLACASAFCVWRTAGLSFLRASSANLLTDLEAAEVTAMEIDRLSALPATALSPGISDASFLRDLKESFVAAGALPGGILDIAIERRTDERMAPGELGLSKRAGRATFANLTLPQLGRVLNTMRVRLPPVRIEQISLKKEPGAADPPQFRVSMTFAAYAPLESSRTAGLPSGQ
jgi:hypothetical protein